MSTLNMKRSSCASGSGYVPSSSIGFCVASTKNGDGSGRVSPNVVTRRSCIASSSADCVFGDARLISSASSRFVKIGPAWKTNCLLPVALLQDVAAGDVRRQQVGRELDAADVERQQPRERLDELGLAQARQTFEQHMSPGEQRRDDLVDHLLLAEDHAAQLVDDARDLRLAVGDAMRERAAWTSVSAHRWLTSSSASASKYFFTAL